MANDAPLYPIGGGGLRGWMFRQIFGNRLLSAFAQRNFILQKNVPIWIDMENLLQVYLMVPHLRAVIDRKAEMFSNGRFCVVNKKGNEIEDHPIIGILENPNCLQTQEKYLFQYSIFDDIYASTFQYKVAPKVGFDLSPRALWNLPPANMRVIPTGQLWNETKIGGIISKFTMENGSVNGTIRDFTTEDIIYTTSAIGAHYITGESKLISLQKPLSNIVGALRTRNCIIFDRGAMGLLSHQSKDQMGGIPLGETERKMVESQMRNEYGIQDGQMRTIITEASLSYQSMTFPTKELMLFEEIEDDFSIICGTYGMSRDIFPSVKGATFENAEQAIKQTYQNTIQPCADSYCKLIMQDPGFAPLFSRGHELQLNYDHLPVMKEDEKSEADADKADAEARDQYIKTIISLNQEIAAGNMDHAQAVELLVMQCEYAPEDAKKVLRANAKPQPEPVAQPVTP